MCLVHFFPIEYGKMFFVIHNQSELLAKFSHVLFVHGLFIRRTPPSMQKFFFFYINVVSIAFT